MMLVWRLERVCCDLQLARVQDSTIILASASQIEDMTNGSHDSYQGCLFGRSGMILQQAITLLIYHL